MQSGSPIQGAYVLAALIAAAPAQAAEFSIDEDTDLSIYGSIEPKIISETGADGDASTELDDEDSALGVRAAHRLGAGLTAFGQIEVEFSSDRGDNGNGGALDEQDSAFAGVEGGFGKLKAGNFDSVYEDLIIDATEVAEDAEISDEAFASEDNQIAYYSPSLGGLSLRSQVRIQGREELQSNGVAADEADNEAGIAVAGGYSGEHLGLYVGFDDRGAETVTDYDSNGNPVGTKVSDSATYGVAATAALSPVSIGAKFAVQDNPDNDPMGNETTFSALRATLDYGAGSVYTAAQQVAPADGDERTEVTLGADYNVFSDLELWSELGRFDRPNDEGDNFMVGAILSF